MSEPVVAVVVAAGLGVRYGGTRPKPMLRVGGRPVVALAVEALAGGGCTQVVVVTGPGGADAFAPLLQGAPIPVRFVPGGATRTESVQAGLAAVAGDPALAGTRIVLVHDAVRPLQPASVVAGVIAAVATGAVAVAPALPVNDSIREVGRDGSHAVDRALLRAVQTPQGFDLAVLAGSHAAAAAAGLSFTDDLTCCEHAGHPVTLVAGSRLGLKITEPVDLVLARALWRDRDRAGGPA